MQSWEFASAWILGIFTQSFANDGEAIALCRMGLLNLEKSLETLRRAEPHRSNGDDARMIKEVKEILRILNVNYAGLFIKCPELQRLIDLSFNRILSWEKNPYDSVNHPSFVGVSLGEIWGYSAECSEISKIKEIQNVLHASFFKRARFRLGEIFSKMGCSCCFCCH